MIHPARWLGAAIAIAAGCGGGGGASPDAPAGDAGADAGADLVLTSAAFTTGAAIPSAHTCKGANTSPPLAWTGTPPAGTKSYAIVMTDTSLTPALVHWVLYDIPPTTTSLPAGVDHGYAPVAVAAHQTDSYDGTTIGYLGPCPPATHSYELALYAVLASALPGATMDTPRNDAVNLITAHALSRRPATLTGTFTP